MQTNLRNLIYALQNFQGIQSSKDEYPFHENLQHVRRGVSRFASSDRHQGVRALPPSL